jgi:hypothetical protein
MAISEFRPRRADQELNFRMCGKGERRQNDQKENQQGRVTSIGLSFYRRYSRCCLHGMPRKSSIRHTGSSKTPGNSRDAETASADLLPVTSNGFRQSSFCLLIWLVPF